MLSWLAWWFGVRSQTHEITQGLRMHVIIRR